jgi:putative transposase
VLWYAISFRHSKEFILEAIKQAIQKTWAIPMIFHSDQWSEYRSFLVLQFLSENHIQISMSKKWSPWENGSQESYYGKFKLELGKPNTFGSIEELVVAIHHRIAYYNTKRIHTKLKMPPRQFRILQESKLQKINQQTFTQNKNLPHFPILPLSVGR